MKLLSKTSRVCLSPSTRYLGLALLFRLVAKSDLYLPICKVAKSDRAFPMRIVANSDLAPPIFIFVKSNLALHI